jgi:uncharacterized protein YoxC
MSEGTLFNPGFLGSHFNWWIGQIADDSYWRDNITPGIHESKGSIPGWGRRYKVRIVGLHDQEEEVLPSDQLPWAQVMYPVTSGGGQANSGQTSNLRQGMFVFGFFLDGQDQQVPVIMGILGNNSQTNLSTRIGLTSSNFSGTSGFAQEQDPKSRETKEKVPDYGKEVEKPKAAEQTQECAAPPPGVKLNKNGLRPDLSLTKAQFADAQSARVEADSRGLTGPAREDFIQQKVAEGIKNRCQQANSPGSPSQPGATIEQVDSVHKLNASHVKREEKLGECIPLMKPDDKVGSALKGVQTVLDNLTQKIDKYLNSINSYIDAVSNTVSSLQSLISSAACEIAKYLKLIFDKIMEYVLKILNKETTKIVSAIPSSMRHMFSDIKEILIELILCLYNKITQGLCALIEGLLNQALKPDELERLVRQSGNFGTKSSPQVPMCYAEDLVGNVISFHKQQITEANNTVLENLNAFLEDIQKEIAGVSGAFSDITSLIGGISGNMSSALSFTNIKLDIFGCELKPNVAVSDCYTFARGGVAKPDSQTPSVKGVENASSKPSTARSIEPLQFAEPSKATADVDLRR